MASKKELEDKLKELREQIKDIKTLVVTGSVNNMKYYCKKENRYFIVTQTLTSSDMLEIAPEWYFGYWEDTGMFQSIRSFAEYVGDLEFEEDFQLYQEPNSVKFLKGE